MKINEGVTIENVVTQRLFPILNLYLSLKRKHHETEQKKMPTAAWRQMKIGLHVIRGHQCRDSHCKENLAIFKYALRMETQTTSKRIVRLSKHLDFFKIWIIIIIISLFQEDNIFGANASLTYGSRLQRRNGIDN